MSYSADTSGETDRFYAYVVVDTSNKPHRRVAIRLSRGEAREFVTEHAATNELRIRRAVVKLYPH